MAGKTVVIVGASSDRTKYGNKSVRAHQAAGWTVIPVNPKGETIEGLTTYSRVADVPGPVNRVSMYVPPEVGERLLAEIAAKTPGELFLNPGSESESLIRKARALGLDPVAACSIVDLGLSPSQFGA
jgi:uncharacterized protein